MSTNKNAGVAPATNTGKEGFQSAESGTHAKLDAAIAKRDPDKVKLDDAIAERDAAKVKLDDAIAERDAAQELIAELKQELSAANRAAGNLVTFSLDGKEYEMQCRKMKIRESKRNPALSAFKGEYTAEEAAQNPELLRALLDSGSGLIKAL